MIGRSLCIEGKVWWVAEPWLVEHYMTLVNAEGDTIIRPVAYLRSYFASI